MQLKNVTATLLIIFLPIFSFALRYKSVSYSSCCEINTANATMPLPADTIYNSTKVLPETLAFNDEVLMAIDAAKVRYNFYNGSLIITKTTVSNAGKAAVDLESFLVSKGYKMLAYGGVSMELKGFKIVKHSNCFEVIIGRI